MTPRLSALLVQDRVVSFRQMDAAVQRQRRYGGRIGTNLLELGAIDEATLNRYLAIQQSNRCVSAEQLRRAEPDVIETMPRERAIELGALPLRREDGRIQVLTVDPIDIETWDDLRTEIGADIEPLAVSEFRFWHALSVFHRVDVPERYRDLVASHPLAIGYLETERAAPESVQTPEWPTDGSIPGLTWSIAELTAFYRASDSRDRLLLSTLGFVGTFFRRRAMLVVTRSGLLGYVAQGFGDRDGDISAVRISVDQRSPLWPLCMGESYFLGPATDIGLDAFYDALDVPHPSECVVLPIRVGPRAAVLLVGDHESDALDQRLLAVCFVLASQLSAALERLIREMKVRRSGMQKAVPESMSPPKAPTEALPEDTARRVAMERSRIISAVADTTTDMAHGVHRLPAEGWDLPDIDQITAKTLQMAPLDPDTLASMGDGEDSTLQPVEDDAPAPDAFDQRPSSARYVDLSRTSSLGDAAANDDLLASLDAAVDQAIARDSADHAIVETEVDLGLPTGESDAEGDASSEAAPIAEAEEATGAGEAPTAPDNGDDAKAEAADAVTEKLPRRSDAAEAPTNDDDTSDEATDDPATDDPTTDDEATDDPTTDDEATDAPAKDDETDDEATVDDSASDDGASDDSASDDSASDDGAPGAAAPVGGATQLLDAVAAPTAAPDEGEADSAPGSTRALGAVAAPDTAPTTTMAMTPVDAPSTSTDRGPIAASDEPTESAATDAVATGEPTESAASDAVTTDDEAPDTEPTSETAKATAALHAIAADAGWDEAVTTGQNPTVAPAPTAPTAPTANADGLDEPRTSTGRHLKLSESERRATERVAKVVVRRSQKLHAAKRLEADADEVSFESVPTESLSPVNPPDDLDTEIVVEEPQAVEAAFSPVALAAAAAAAREASSPDIPVPGAVATPDLAGPADDEEASSTSPGGAGPRARTTAPHSAIALDHDLDTALGEAAARAAAARAEGIVPGVLSYESLGGGDPNRPPPRGRRIQHTPIALDVAMPGVLQPPQPSDPRSDDERALRAEIATAPPERLVALLRDERRYARDCAFVALLERGESAWPAVLESFPYPLTTPRRDAVREGVPLESHGPIIWLAALQGRSMLPLIGPLASHEEADTRFYAMQLAIRSGAPDAADLAIGRLLDRDEQIRAFALKYVEQGHDPNLANAAAVFARRGLGSDQPWRVDIAIGLSAHFRDADSAPILIGLLSHESERTRNRAANALTRLSFMPFGTNRRKWEKWYRKCGTMDARQWMLDAMVHRDRKVREAVGRELRQSARIVVNYDPDFSSRQLKLAQRSVERYFEAHPDLRSAFL